MPRGTQGTPRALPGFAYGPITLYGRTFQSFLLPFQVPPRGPPTPKPPKRPGFGLLRLRSPLLTESLLISSPPGTEMFQFPGFASLERDDRLLRRPGSPIRTPPDQSLFSGSPKLFAANRVLPRLSAPRHPPSALLSLTVALSGQSTQTRPRLLLSTHPYSVVKDPRDHPTSASSAKSHPRAIQQIKPTWWR